ncbi:hypothetical protein F5Y09DRAFT_48008 [Xylaria sp. FL1042]|nr:hypothetical protein F5Y09DRAFT_48008 [Xylaria sp. FL1042]
MSGARLGGGPATQRKGEIGTSRQSQHASYSHPTVPEVEDFGDMGQDDRLETGIKDLIEFLKMTPPPPTNYMSIPDNFSSSSSEDDRWDKFKRKIFRYRRKARKRRPPVIMLPDSAVSARTIGGHRYIAISIPMQYSPLAPLAQSQYPIYDSIEAAFQREVNSMLGTGKKPPRRVGTVLHPVAEDRESMSSSSPPLTASERPEQPTVLPSPSRRARSHSIPLLPSQEQRYTPRRDPSKSRSIDSARSVPHLSGLAAITQSSEEKHTPWPAIAEMNALRPSSKDVLTETVPKGTEVVEPSTSRVLEKPIITLTLPPRRSSKRGKGLELTPIEPIEKVIGPNNDSPASPNDSNTNNNGNGSGNESGDRARGSFAASIDTTGSSPQLLKAQTAMAVQSVPIIVTQAGAAEPESSPDPNASELPARKGGIEPSTQELPAGPPPPLVSDVEEPQRTKKGVQERTQRNTEKTRMERKGKENETVSEPYTPDMPASSSVPKRPPGTPTHHHRGGENTSSTPTTSSDHSPVTSSASTHGRGYPTARSFSRRKRGHEERQARYIARALAEEKETLENLPREELIRRYEALREQRVYEREKRLRRLERSRDSWIRAVPMLLQDLNGLLREQHRILEGARLTYASEQQHQHHHLQRSRSVEVSSSSPSDRGADPLDTRRSQSLHGSRESRLGHRPSGLAS